MYLFKHDLRSEVFQQGAPFEVRLTVIRRLQRRIFLPCTDRARHWNSPVFRQRRENCWFLGRCHLHSPDQHLQETLEFLHLHRPVEVLLSVAAHLLRVVGVGADLLRERQDPLDINWVLVSGEAKDVGEVGRKVRQLCNNIGDPPGTVFPSLQLRCLRQPFPVDTKASHCDMALIEESIESLTRQKAVEGY